MGYAQATARLRARSKAAAMRVVQDYLDKVFKRPELADAAITKLGTKRDGNLQTRQFPITNIRLSP
jgi:hypothetical protein